MSKLGYSEPAFLTGAHRSGTTLLGLMLDSHPELSWFHHFEWVVRYIGVDGTWPTVSEYQKVLDNDRGWESWGLSIETKATSYPDIVNGFLKQRRERDGKPFSGATIHTRYTELPKIWPNARFIHIVRDPRDKARSTIKAGWTGNAWGAAKKWRAAETEWERLCTLVPEERRLFIKFEDLVSEPVQTLQKVSQFLGISYTEEMFSYTNYTPYSYPDPKMALKWKRSMSPEDVEMVELAAGSLLDARGYERISGRMKVSFVEAIQLEFMDRWKKSKLRISRYGWKLWFLQFLARRLGNPPQLKWALNKVDEMDAENLQSSEQYITDPNAVKAH